MAEFMKFKNENPKMKQTEIANQLGMSSSTLQRYRNDIIMLSPYRINSNNTKKRSKKAKIDDISDLKRPQMTTNDLETSQSNTKSNRKNKNIVKGGSAPDKVEINEHYLDKILRNNNS